MKRRFLHRMKKLPQVFSFMNEYEINGLRWHGVSYSDYDTLSIHREGDVIIEVRHCYSEDGFSWDWSKKLSDGVYARRSGKEVGVLEACATALDYSPRILQMTYLGENTTWYEMAPGRFSACIEGDEANIRETTKGKFYFCRYWAPGKAVFEQLSSAAQHLSGETDTANEAMIACVNAPEMFKRACAALVASCSADASD